jgi:hypothetical protein
MAKIRVCQINEIIQRLPDVKAFNSDVSESITSINLFMCALGFEERCLTIPTAMAERTLVADHVVYFEYATNREDNETNRSGLVGQLKQIARDPQPIGADDQRFGTDLRDVLSRISRDHSSGCPTVWFDTSVISNRLMMRCFKAFLEFDINLVALYSEAAIYHPTQAEFDAEPHRWSSEEFKGIEHGVSDVSISEEFPGFHIDQLPDCVILFPSIKKARSKAIINSVDPSLSTSSGENVVWLLGVPHASTDQWRLDAMRTVLDLKPDWPCFEVSTFDYKDALSKLDSIYLSRVDKHKFTLGLMGSNMQTIGAALFCYLHPSVRVVFASPEEYNAQSYSEGCRATWIINFGRLDEIKRQIDRVGMIEIEED